MTFSERLKDLRKERGISQEELAKVLHITRQSISKWTETGAAYPDMEKMKMLSDFYELTLDELMNQESKGASESEKRKNRGWRGTGGSGRKPHSRRIHHRYWSGTCDRQFSFRYRWGIYRSGTSLYH